MPSDTNKIDHLKTRTSTYTNISYFSPMQTHICNYWQRKGKYSYMASWKIVAKKVEELLKTTVNMDEEDHHNDSTVFNDGTVVVIFTLNVNNDARGMSQRLRRLL